MENSVWSTRQRRFKVIVHICIIFVGVTYRFDSYMFFNFLQNLLEFTSSLKFVEVKRIAIANIWFRHNETCVCVFFSKLPRCNSKILPLSNCLYFKPLAFNTFTNKLFFSKFVAKLSAVLQVTSIRS